MGTTSLTPPMKKFETFQSSQQVLANDLHLRSVLHTFLAELFLNDRNS